MSDDSSTTISQDGKSKKKSAKGKRISRKTASAKSSTNTTNDTTASEINTGSVRGEKYGDPRPVKLRILDREVQLACRPGEEDDLMQAAAYIDRSMRDLRRRNATSSIEKISIVTAINTANALLKSRGKQVADPGTSERVAKLNSQLDDLLADSNDGDDESVNDDTQ